MGGEAQHLAPGRRGLSLPKSLDQSVHSRSRFLLVVPSLSFSLFSFQQAPPPVFFPKRGTHTDTEERKTSSLLPPPWCTHPLPLHLCQPHAHTHGGGGLRGRRRSHTQGSRSSSSPSPRGQKGNSLLFVMLLPLPSLGASFLAAAAQSAAASRHHDVYESHKVMCETRDAHVT